MHRELEEECKDRNAEGMPEELKGQGDCSFGRLGAGFSYNTDFGQVGKGGVSDGQEEQ